MADLIDTTEMYLRTVLELEEDGIVPMRARISERIGHSGPTVSQTVARMERDGLIIVEADRQLQLTDEGRVQAVRVMRKHRLAELLLADVIGLEWEQLHEEACRWEHVISENVEKKLLVMLGNPTVSPYGNTIPGLAELGMRSTGYPRTNAVSVLQLLRESAEGTLRAEIRRLGEPAQAHAAQLCVFSEAGLRPGISADFRLLGDRVQVITEAGVTIDFSAGFATHLFVS